MRDERETADIVTRARDEGVRRDHLLADDARGRVDQRERGDEEIMEAEPHERTQRRGVRDPRLLRESNEGIINQSIINQRSGV